MHEVDVSLATEFAESGRYEDALRVLSASPREHLRRSEEARVLLSEVLQECGRLEEADLMARPLSRPGASHPKSRARALAVIGRAAYEQGRIGESTECLAEALRLAREMGDTNLSCLIQLAALGGVADSWPREALAAYVAELRQSVLRLGDARALAVLHQQLAKFEALHGNLDRAKRHLKLTRRHLAKVENPSLAGSAAVTESNICWFDFQLSEALALSREAAALFKESGETRDQLVAEANSCWFALFLGRFAESEDNLRRLLNRDMPLFLRLIMLDTLAELLLSTERLGEADEVVREVSDVLARLPKDKPSYYELSAQECRYALLAKKHDWSSAETVAETALGTAVARGELVAQLRFRLFRGRARLHLRGLPDATDDVVTAVTNVSRLPIGNRAHCEQMIGLLRARLQQRSHAAEALRRAYRINRATKNVRSNLAVVTDYASLTFQRKSKNPVPLASRGPGLYSEQVLECLSRCTEFPERIVDLATIAHGVGTTLQIAARADLLAYECFELLRSLECGAGLTLASQAGQEAPTVLACDGWDYRTARQRAQQPDDATVIDCGAHAGRRYRVTVEPRPDLASRLGVVAIGHIVDAALDLERYRREERERASLWPPEPEPDSADEVFRSADMLEILATAKRVAPTDLPVLLTGETGTGKEVLARAVHRASPRADKPFLAFNCTAVPRDMLESQLFGYRRGAFTGAHEAFSGVIRAAGGGTLFLDEIGELPLDIQPKLLRFLETREVHALGDARPLTVDVRIVAATNADLDRMVGEGRFRADLYYRLNVIRFHLPPLRERREEIPPLVQHFLRRFGTELHRGLPRLSEETLEYLLLHAWPGNVRQLANELHRAVALADADGVITPDHLSAEVRASRRTIAAGPPPRPDHEITIRIDQPLDAALESVERLMVARALERCQDRYEDAARMLGISRKGLFLKRRRYGLDPPPSFA